MVESRTKIQLSEAQVAELVGHAFGDVRLARARELTDGYFNTAYRVELDDGRALVLKAAPPARAEVLTYERGLMRAEVEAMRLVASDPEVPVPSVRHADFSQVHLPVDHFFMDVVPGSPWSTLRDGLDDEQNAEIERQLGRITARINRIEGPVFGYPMVGPRFDAWIDAFSWMCRTLYADGRRWGIAPALVESELLAHLERYRGAFHGVVRPRLVHWDLWAGNVFVRLEGDRPVVSGVIDFERALWGDPLMEFVPGRLGGIDAYEEGYGAALLATREARLRRIFYNAYLGLVLVIEDGPRQYADKSTVEWGRGLLERASIMLRHGDILEDQLAFA